MIIQLFFLPLLYRLAFSILLAASTMALAQNAPKANNLGTTSASPSPPASVSKLRNLDGVAAIVNTGYITRKDIDDRVSELQGQISKSGKPMPDSVTLRKEVLER